VAVRYRALRGTRDILPEEAVRWQRLEAATRSVFGRYGFGEIRTPAFESTELFTRSVGTSTDIVRKEMYTLTVGDESITLRPEATAPVARAVVEHALHRGIALGYPERLYYMGPMFRHERPQKGRQRQFHQIGAEVLGASEPLADAETIEMVWALLSEVGIGDRELRLNSVGDQESRTAYRAALTAWLAPHLPVMCEDCRRRAVENPLRVFDCKVEADQRRLEGAPKLLDHLEGDAAAHFAEVRAHLDAYGIPYVIDPRLVRGLDYYTRTAWEWQWTELGAQSALSGGGRYDGLAEELGGQHVPGVGFGAGIERLLIALEHAGAAVPEDEGIDVFFVCADGADRASVLAKVMELRAEGVRADADFAGRSVKGQHTQAGRLGAKKVVVVERDTDLAEAIA